MGILSIEGTDNNADSEVKIVVKATAGFPSNALLPLQPTDLGVVNLGGITISSDSLRRRTRLVAGISGDVTGDISVGQVHRLQVGGFNAVEGIIHGNVTALARDREFFNTTGLTFKSVEYVKADGLYGTLEATGDAAYAAGDLNTYARIDKVVLGGSQLSGGLRGSCTPLGTQTCSPVWVARLIRSHINNVL